MAVSNIYNSLTFGEVNSADYGIYITGEGVYNAPKRAVDMVDVPGRNGAIAIDQGRWDNVTVEYPAGTFGMTEAEFRTAVSDFRNAIVSQIGYQRLTDTYHPDEYRMALYVEGLEVEPAPRQQAGEFTLKFNCKPQRWLANGETAIVVASGDTLTNPTPYDAGPLLAVEGYGTIGFNGYDIELADGAIGTVTLADSGTISTITIPPRILNAGDVLSFGSTVFNWSTKGVNGWYFVKPALSPHISDSGDGTTETTSTDASETRNYVTTFPAFSFNYGTASTKTNTTTISDRVLPSGGTGAMTMNATAVQTIAYDGDSTITYTYSVTVSTTTYATGSKDGMSHGAITAASTVNVLGHPTYVDCEIGEAYKIENDEYISLNAYIALGSDLPVLKSGANAISIDNTVTELKVKPNWWKL
jgi:phage-related protein